MIAFEASALDFRGGKDHIERWGALEPVDDCNNFLEATQIIYMPAPWH
jgi:hypothetical protein